MPIPLPKLDDRTFAQLCEQAIARARKTAPEWTDFSPGDPGVTLLELFAYLTEAMLYRLNRVPPKLRIALLNLAGVSLHPPSAAVVTLVFTRAQGAASDQPVTIPAGTPVATQDGSVQVLTLAAATIDPGKDSAEATALHCEQIDAEALGQTSGTAGQAFRLARAPVIRPSGDGLDVLVGVELAKGAQGAGLPRRTVDGKTFEIWREVSSFTANGPDDPVYMIDRSTGLVQFGPLPGTEIGSGRVPREGLAVCAWYRRGGGKAGNVAPGVLTALKNGPPGLAVTNPDVGKGGADAETLEEVERRAPSAMSSMRIAVTARDYEQVVLDTGDIAKAHAYAQAQVWRHAEPGTVEIAVLPQIDVAALSEGEVSADVVEAGRTDALRERTAAAIDSRRPLGVRTVISWAQVRPVSLSVRVAIGIEAKPAEVRRQVRREINRLLSPLRDVPFGQPLRASEVYERILRVPGVRYADGITFSIDDTPAANVTDLIADPAQTGVWFAVTKDAVLRTLDNGISWTAVFKPASGEPRFVRRHPDRPGLAVLAAVSSDGSAVHVSRDLGEDWGKPLVNFKEEVFDAAWIERNGQPMLLVATEAGLRQIVPSEGGGATAVRVDQAIDTDGYWTVAATTSPLGVLSVAVAARKKKGVYLSTLGGVSDSFAKRGLDGKDVRVLAVQKTAGRSFLWATIHAEGGEQGEGAQRLNLRDDGATDPDGFKPFNLKWNGGSCEGIAFADNLVFGASNRDGLHVLDCAVAKPAWAVASANSGLPIRDFDRFFEVVSACAAAEVPGRAPIVMSGGIKGVHRSTDGGKSFASVGHGLHTDRVPLPARWLYCTGKLDITVDVDQDRRD